MKKKRHLSCNAVGGCRRISHPERKPPKWTIAEELKGKSSINDKKSKSLMLSEGLVNGS